MQIDPGDPERAYALRELRRDVPQQIDEATLRARRDLALQPGVLDPQQVREGLDSLRPRIELARIDPHRIDRGADRERLPVAIQDLAPVGRGLDDPQVPALSLILEERALRELQVGGPPDERRRRRQHRGHRQTAAPRTARWTRLPQSSPLPSGNHQHEVFGFRHPETELPARDAFDALVRRPGALLET